MSYERILEVENWLTTSVCQRFRDEDSVCPTNVRSNLFTVGALDNIDHNLSSTTAQGSFHGTSISLFQFPTEANKGIHRPPITIPPPENAGPATLPETYSVVPAVACNIDRVTVPEAEIPNSDSHLEGEKEKEHIWLQQSIQLLSNDMIQEYDNISWASYHASLQPQTTNPAGISALLPLFFEKAATIPMIHHGMTILKQLTAKCNPGQIPVMAVDQPLFALAKYVQWTWPELFSEKSFVVMFGGLHIEIALWRMLGRLLEGSDWTIALSEAGVASAGTANSFLQVTHMTRTRHAHQVSALCLAKLQKNAYETAQVACSFDTWKQNMCRTRPSFMFWDLILQLELLVLIFVRSHREQNLSLYIEVLEELTPCFLHWISLTMPDGFLCTYGI